MDTGIYGVMTVMAEVPSFLIGIALLFLVAAQVKWIPLSGAFSSFARYQNEWEHVSDILIHSLMPVSAMVLAAVQKRQTVFLLDAYIDQALRFPAT